MGTDCAHDVHSIVATPLATWSASHEKVLVPTAMASAANTVVAIACATAAILVSISALLQLQVLLRILLLLMLLPLQLPVCTMIEFKATTPLGAPHNGLGCTTGAWHPPSVLGQVALVMAAVRHLRRCQYRFG